MIDHTQDADRSEGASVFDEHRGLLVSVAYRFLGSVTDAEDAVQETWIRWSGADHSSGGEPRKAGRRPGSRAASMKRSHGLEARLRKMSPPDASSLGGILELLVRLKDEVGMTLVLITHDLAFAWALADRVAIMYLGKIVELGPAQTVLTEPLHPYTKSLLTVTPEVGRRRTHTVLTGEPPDPAHIPRAAASTPAFRCCAREKQAPKNPAAWERSRLSKSLHPAIEQPATWRRPEPARAVSRNLDC